MQILSEQFRLAAKDWCEKDAAANLLEETKSAVLSERMAALGDIPVSKAEMTVKASRDWREFIETMVSARKDANLARVKMQWVQMKFSEWQSAEANARAERKM